MRVEYRRNEWRNTITWRCLECRERGEVHHRRIVGGMAASVGHDCPGPGGDDGTLVDEHKQQTTKGSETSERPSSQNAEACQESVEGGSGAYLTGRAVETLA